MSQKQLQTLLGRKQEGPRPLGAAAAAYSPAPSRGASPCGGCQEFPSAVSPMPVTLHKSHACRKFQTHQLLKQIKSLY